MNCFIRKAPLDEFDSYFKNYQEYNGARLSFSEWRRPRQADCHEFKTPLVGLHGELQASRGTQCETLSR